MKKFRPKRITSGGEARVYCTDDYTMMVIEWTSKDGGKWLDARGGYLDLQSIAVVRVVATASLGEANAVQS
jgi:hypothetical protein